MMIIPLTPQWGETGGLRAPISELSKKEKN
jgi:hypothetical protein